MKTQGTQKMSGRPKERREPVECACRPLFEWALLTARQPYTAASPTMQPSAAPPPDAAPRRNFLKQFVTGVLTGIAGLVPALAGLAVIFDPLKRRGGSPGEALLVARLPSLAPDGVPRRFRGYADRVDAWNTYKNIPIGAVFLRRTADNQVSALNAACPHAGCSVSFASGPGQFLCPCHDSSFTVEGAIAKPSSPSPRSLDRLEVEIRRDNEVWVKFRNYQPGHKEQVPVA